MTPARHPLVHRDEEHRRPGLGQQTQLGTTNRAIATASFADCSWMSPNRPSAVTGTWPPGGTYKFQFDLHAPDAPGTYYEYFNLVAGERRLVQRSRAGRPAGRRSRGSDPRRRRTRCRSRRIERRQRQRIEREAPPGRRAARPPRDRVAAASPARAVAARPRRVGETRPVTMPAARATTPAGEAVTARRGLRVAAASRLRARARE